MTQVVTARVSGTTEGIRSTLARAADLALGGFSATALAGRGCCFTFHRVATTAEWSNLPNRGFHIDLSYLERLIVHLQTTGWDIVTISEALNRLGQPGAGRFVNFSVDDVYRDAVELLVPLCQRLDVPITLFLTTGIPDGQFRLRDAGLETILQRQSTCSDAGHAYPLRTFDQKRDAFTTISARWDASPDPDDCYVQFSLQHGHDPHELDEFHRVTWPMIEALADEPLVEIGGHTVLHRRISSLDEAEAIDEIAGCRDRLEAKLGRTVEHFAFPYGRAGDCSVRDFELVKRAGFRSASTTRKGLISRRSDPFQLPRNTLNGHHRRLPFAYAHLTGASGVSARMMRRD